MEIRYTLTPKEYGEAYGLMLGNAGFRYRLAYWRFTWLGPLLGIIILGCAAIIVAMGGEDTYLPYLLVVFLVAGFVSLASPLRFRGMSRKHVRMQNLDREAIVSVGPEGIVGKREGKDAEARFGWSSLEKQIESKNLFIFFPNRLQFIPLPKRAMTDQQQQELRALIAAHIPGSTAPPAAQPAVS